jgi:hypothetical protein
MNPKVRSFERPSRPSEHPSVLGGPQYIRGLPHDKQSPVDEARAHPEQAKACKSVLDGPSCILGLPH